MTRNVVLFEDNDGMWIVDCPSLPGCMSQGETREEAIANIREAIDLWMEDARLADEPIPDDAPIEVMRV